MFWRSISAVLLVFAAGACSSAEPIDGCPINTVPVGSRCLVACAGPLDCLANESCDPLIGACRPSGEDASVPGDATSDPDLGEATDAGARDAEEHKDAGAIDTGSPRDSGDMDAGRQDMTVNPDAETPDVPPPDLGPRVDGGFALQVPDRIEFGDWPTHCPPGMPQQALIENTGSGAIDVVRVDILPGFTPFFVDQTTLPRRLSPGQSTSVFFNFSPQNAAEFMASATVIHQPSMMPAVIQLAGRGVDASATERFNQVLGQVDILFIVDDSGSMGDLQTQLAAQIPGLLGALAGRYDFHIAVTTTDVAVGGAQGAFIGTPAVLTPMTPNLSMVLSQRVQPGINGSGDEQGLNAAIRALTPPLINGPNAGFLRPSAALVIIVFSDEEDHSLGDVTTLGSTIENIKNNPAATALNAIVYFAGSSNCSAAVDPGTRYVAVAQQTGGVTADICGPSFTAPLQTYPPSGIPRRSSFALANAPEPGTITVTVGGSTNNSWSFDPQNNAIVFPPNAEPDYGSAIVVSYQRACP